MMSCVRLIRYLARAVLACVLCIAIAGECAPTGLQHRSYLTLSKVSASITLPYVWQQTDGVKHLVVLGTRHNHDPRSPMYVRLGMELRQARPQVLIHESTVPADILKESATGAIARGADLGFSAQLATKLGAILRSGDAPVHEEIEGLLKTQPAQNVFVFLVAQRFVGSEGRPDAQKLERDYPSFVRDYLEANGLSLKGEWKTWDGFRNAFMHVTGRSFSVTTWQPNLLNPLYNTGALSDVVRSSEKSRDAYLVAAIREELQLHDRVAVVFGYWHVLAIEPELGALLPPH